MSKKYTDETSLLRLILKIKTDLSGKSNNGHTHDRVNGYKIVVSSSAPTVNDTSVITVVV